MSVRSLKISLSSASFDTVPQGLAKYASDFEGLRPGAKGE